MELAPLTFEALAGKARTIAAGGRQGHIHTTAPGCTITRDPRWAIVLEDTAEGRAYAWFHDQPIEDRAKPLAVLLHGAESVPGEGEVLTPPSPGVQRMAERFREGRGHFHILNPQCLVNSHPGRWAIVFEDEELGTLESLSEERPLNDIRVVERLIYAARPDPGA